MNHWKVVPTIIDEYVPAPRDAYRVQNAFTGEIADDSVYEDYEAAEHHAAALNAAEHPAYAELPPLSQETVKRLAEAMSEPPSR